MAPALAIRDVRKSFGAQPVLDGLDLVVPDGSLTAVLGPSGSGKTTLLRLIAGFERADAGTIRVGDLVVSQPPRHVAPEHRGVGIVAQEGSLFPHLDVAANVGFGLSRAGRRSGRVQELLRLVGLAGFERRYPHELSGGEQQRVALARALAPRPRLILLDEPFSALDPLLRADLRNQVREALRAAGSTALLVTHDQLEALSIADQVGVMRRGRLVQVADPQTLYRKPVDVELARFVGEAVLVPGSIATGHIQCALGRLALDNPALADGPATAMLRPEQVVVNVNGNGSPGGVSGRVERITFHGPDALVHLALSACDDLDIVARVAGHALPSLGQPVTLSVNGPVVAFTGNLDDGRPGSLSRRPQIEPA